MTTTDNPPEITEAQLDDIYADGYAEGWDHAQAYMNFREKWFNPLSFLAGLLAGGILTALFLFFFPL